MEIKKESVDKKDPTYRTVLSDFIKSVPCDKPLCEPNDKRKIQERAIAFGQIYNAFLIIMRGYGSLVRWEEKREIIRRIPALRQEASFWTGFTDKGRHFGREVDNIIEEYIPKLDIRKYQEEKEENNK